MVTLYVDGVTYDPYLVTDDWPIHPSQIDVQLTVGACWQGGWATDGDDDGDEDAGGGRGDGSDNETAKKTTTETKV